MPEANNSYAFYADYSQMATCLFAIQAIDDGGGFDSQAEVGMLLSNFDQDALQKLYNRTLMVLGMIDGNKTVTEAYLKGDFEGLDFTAYDFHVGYLDTTNNGYSSRFRTILNIFEEFKSRLDDISTALALAVDEALIPVLDAFEDLQVYLTATALNPCVPSASTLFYNNSQTLYLQAAGSTDEDGTVEGIHLRWSLAGDLGDHHFPKGNYAQSSIGYNKSDDFVYLERTSYLPSVNTQIDFSVAKPVVNYQTKIWSYIVNTFSNGVVNANRIRLYFKDSAAYDQVAATVDAVKNPVDFLTAYSNELEIDFSQKNIFSFGIILNKSGVAPEAILKLEAMSKVDGETTGIRDTISIDTSTPAITKNYLGDNISKIRFRANGGYLRNLTFETYHDFLNSKNPEDWETIGNGFALSLDDQEAFDRLESPGKIIDNLWPHYNEGTRVRAQNYRDKWKVSHTDDPSIKNLAEDYISLSETDPRAVGELAQENLSPEQQAQSLEISYLDMLNLQALDYHLARILGLGYIDASAGNTKYIYRIRYTNKKDMASADMQEYSFLSLPTGKTDKRLPSKPAIRPVSYHLPYTDEQTFTAFDEQGYSMLSNLRLVNIGREAYSFEKEEDDFFEIPLLTKSFNIFENSKAVLYGVEYRPITQQNYVKPEITNDKSIGQVYFDYDDDFPVAGVPETAPVPDDAESLYAHFESRSGVHVYAIYGINLFSRASVSSDEVATDETAFIKKNTLLPPTDLTVQYIQKETTLLFTTQTEQNWLAGRNSTFLGKDTPFTRVCFNWLDVTDISHIQNPEANIFEEMVKPNKIKLFFKEQRPTELRGVISQIKEAAGEPHQLLLYTDGYYLLNGEYILPIADGTATSKYVNGILRIDEGQFRVVAITAGEHPVITVEKIKETENVEDPETPGSFATRDHYRSPVIGSRFNLTENLSKPENWQPLVKDISLVDFTDEENPIIESSTDNEGNVTSYLIGGITAEALIQPLSDEIKDIPGFYTITYGSGVGLDPNPQVNLPYDPAAPSANNPETLQNPHVEWYKGLVRVPLENSNEKILLEVSRMVQTNPLTLYVFHPGQADHPIKLSADEQDTIAGVNFHPGYRAYLFSEPLPNVFNRNGIYPSENELSKKTLFALQAAEERPGGSGYVSKVSSPAILLARQIMELQPPEKPRYFGLKIRPDATGRAAFTFDIGIKPDTNGSLRSPFGFYFYRASNEDLLAALYEPETVSTILADLTALTEDSFFNQRYIELADVTFDQANDGHFKIYTAEPNPYGFPDPDKWGLVLPEDSIAIRKEKYQEAVRLALLPLTEQVPIYAFIKTGEQTKNELPVIKDMDGNLLSPQNPAFNPFPMIRRFLSSEKSYVRFTDYNLSGASRFLYFYTAAETTNELIPGTLSPFAGPVEILQTLPSEAPVIRSFTYQPQGTAPNLSAVSFKLSAVSPNGAISGVRIYRSPTESETSPLQVMESFTDVAFPFGDPDLQVTDDFENVTDIPFGESMYYRLAFIRIISNENNEDEQVLSHGSDVIEVKLIDSANPEAPELNYDGSTNSLHWEPTVYKGTYYLYKQNSWGSWEKIAETTQFADQGEMAYNLPEPLPAVDEDGDPLYHRFKVRVENASGLFNLVEEELTV